MPATQGSPPTTPAKSDASAFLTRADQDEKFPTTKKGNRGTKKDHAKNKSKVSKDPNPAPKKRGRPPKQREEVQGPGAKKIRRSKPNQGNSKEQSKKKDEAHAEPTDQDTTPKKAAARAKAKASAKGIGKGKAKAKAKVAPKQDPPASAKGKATASKGHNKRSSDDDGVKCPVNQNWQHTRLVVYWSRNNVGLKLVATNQQVPLPKYVVQLMTGKSVSHKLAC